MACECVSVCVCFCQSMSVSVLFFVFGMGGGRFQMSKYTNNTLLNQIHVHCKNACCI